jgi:hypothetical protein
MARAWPPAVGEGHDGRLRTVGGHHRPPGPAGPTFQAVERHSTTIAASADQVWAAPAQVTVGELRLFRLLRVACTGARSTRRFARYWWLIRSAGGAIRRSWLAAIKRRAERHEKTKPNPRSVLAADAVAPAGCSHRRAGIL